MTATTTVVDQPDASRYEILSDGELAGHLDYRHEDDHIVLVHLEMVPAFQGRGLAFALAQGVFDNVRARGVMVDPECPYMARWIAKHPEYSDVVVPAGDLAPDSTA